MRCWPVYTRTGSENYDWMIRRFLLFLCSISAYLFPQLPTAVDLQLADKRERKDADAKKPTLQALTSEFQQTIIFEIVFKFEILPLSNPSVHRPPKRVYLYLGFTDIQQWFGGFGEGLLNVTFRDRQTDGPTDEARSRFYKYCSRAELADLRFAPVENLQSEQNISNKIHYA